jgi:hypothetical protein
MHLPKQVHFSWGKYGNKEIGMKNVITDGGCFPSVDYTIPYKI